MPSAIPEPPKSAPASSRNPSNPLAVMSLASIRVQAVVPPTPPSAPKLSPSIPAPPIMTLPQVPPPPQTLRMPSAPEIVEEPAPMTARMPMPSTPAAFATSAPSTAYERAFRQWSSPNLPAYEADDGPDASQGPLTYAVYTAQDMPVARGSGPSVSTASAFVPPPPSLAARISMIAVGAAVVLGTTLAIIVGTSDDAPKAKASATASMTLAPPPVVEPLPSLEPTSLTTTTAGAAPVVMIVDEPAPAAAPAPRIAKAPKPSSSPASIRAAAPPPNPYGGPASAPASKKLSMQTSPF